MFDLIKPGHVLRFGFCPSAIISPQGVTWETHNDNTLATPWPTTSQLGIVKCLSHPSGPIGAVAADVAMNLRDTLAGKMRSASYSPAGQFFTKSNRVIGAANCDFVGYIDGKSCYIQSEQTVFSKDFSGCLMVSYKVGPHRHVAHVAASKTATMDCKQAFLNKFRQSPGDLKGWFKPYVGNDDGDRKITAFKVVGKYISFQVNNLTTFGVMTPTGQAYSIDAFKPSNMIGNDWVVTYIAPKITSQSLQL